MPMREGPPEGPKTRFTAEQASGGQIPRPPSARAVEQISEAQGMLTDDWTGEPPRKSPRAEPGAAGDKG